MPRHANKILWLENQKKNLCTTVEAVRVCRAFNNLHRIAHHHNNLRRERKFNADSQSLVLLPKISPSLHAAKGLQQPFQPQRQAIFRLKTVKNVKPHFSGMAAMEETYSIQGREHGIRSAALTKHTCAEWKGEF